MINNFEESYSLNEDGDILRSVERIAAIYVKDINGKSIGKVRVASCATYRDIHFRVLEIFWEYHFEQNYSVEEISAYLKSIFPGFPEDAQAFLASKKGASPSQ